MLTITYIYHSSFAIETDKCILVFDYWKDPTGVMEKLVIDKAHKHFYVFASHFHADHYNKEIFNWQRENPFTNYTYILSKDILKHRKAKKEEADVWLAKGGCWEDENIKVIATGSNDVGVSWIIEVDDKRIFHAGDLCNWYARFLTESHYANVNQDISSETKTTVNNRANELVFSEEMGTYISPVAEEKRFLGELKDIKKISESFDIVMFPVDGRIGNGYTLGARQFIERFDVGLFVPMHFVMSGFESAWRMQPFCLQRDISFWQISKEGDDITID